MSAKEAATWLLERRSTLTTGCQNQVSVPGRGLAALARDGYYACNLGRLTDADLLRCAWQLNRLGENLVPGQVADLRHVARSPYLTLTRSAVPFHNDGAYRHVPPRYLLLYCRAPGSHGGETLFARGDEIATRLDPQIRNLLRRRSFQIQVAGLGATRRLLLKHPRDGTTVLFFGNPAVSPDFRVSAGRDVPVQQILAILQATLADPQVICYRHNWKRYDLLVFDNYKVLHARTAYRGNRFLKRVEIGPVASGLATASPSFRKASYR